MLAHHLRRLQIAVLGIVAREALETASLHLPKLGADAVEEVTVVRHHQHGVLEVGKEAFQPVETVEVQVVRRLVHHQQIGICEERAGESGAGALTTAGQRRRRVQRVERQPNALDDALHLALVVIAAERLVLLQQLGVPAFGASSRIPVTPLYLQRAGREIILQPEQRVERRHHLVAQCPADVVLRHLRNVRDPESGACRDRSGISLQLGQQHSQQRGLTAAVGTNKPNSGLLANLDADLSEYFKVAVEEPEL